MFSTGDNEVMEILSGDLDVALRGVAGWKAIKGGESFQVPDNSKFTMQVKSLFVK